MSKAKEYLHTHCYTTDSDIPDDNGMVYLSRTDDSYVTRVGMEDDRVINFWIDHGITSLQSSSGKVACIGFSYSEQKWYGWSHRAIYGFGIGSEVKRGDCAYVPADKEDFLADMVMFWADESRLASGIHTTQEGIEGVCISLTYSDSFPNEKLRGTISDCFNPYPDTYGKGEWVAETLEEAKQMAIEFAEGVS